MKYIDADKLKAEIERRIGEQKLYLSANNANNDERRRLIERYESLLSFIDQMQQEQSTPPGIEEERQKKGWLDYGLTIGEIGLHRYNAVARIREHKKEADDIKRRMNPHDLAVLATYSESVGAEVFLCCLQRYCMDFRFDQEEIKEIINKED